VRVKMSKAQRRDGGKTPRLKTTKLNLVVSVELEKEFREAIFKKYGMKRGNITKAIEEAIKEWIEKQ
jgi:predicted nucleic acid-binding protein